MFDDEFGLWKYNLKAIVITCVTFVVLSVCNAILTWSNKVHQEFVYSDTDISTLMSAFWLCVFGLVVWFVTFGELRLLYVFNELIIISVVVYTCVRFFM